MQLKTKEITQKAQTNPQILLLMTLGILQLDQGFGQLHGCASQLQMDALCGCTARAKKRHKGYLCCFFALSFYKESTGANMQTQGAL